jgi:hypothetical protein
MFRNSSTLVYAAIVLGLICYVVFIDKKVPGTKDREEAETELFKINPDEVTGLEINNGKEFFYFQKTNNHWELRKPVDTLADGAAVDGVINQIAFAQPIGFLSTDKFTDANLKEWGLNPPAERVVIHTPTKQYELLVGRKVAINDSVYARASGKKTEPVRILPSSIKDMLERGLSDFRSRNVFEFDVNKVTKIVSRIADTATTPGQQCEIDLKNGTWSMQLPLVARASDADVQGLLGKILGERAIDFVSDDASNLSLYGLTSPTATLSVTLNAEEPMVLEIGGPVTNKPDQVYAKRLKSNSVFTLLKASVDELLKALPNVRDRHIFPFDPNKVVGLSYSFGTKKAQVVASHALWSTVGTAEGPADVEKITDLLAKLSQLETTPVLKDSATDLKPFGLDKPQGKIILQSPEFKPNGSLMLLIGKAENKLLYVRNSTEPFIYTVPDNTFDMLPANNLALRDARAINLNRSQVKSTTFKAGTEPAITLVRSSGGTWSATNIKDRMVNTMQAETQVSLFCQLQAKAWLGPALPAYGLNKPVLTISMVTDQPSPTVLHIGAPLSDGSHAAQVEGSSTVFALSDGDYGILNASSLQPIPAEILSTNAPSSTPPVSPSASKTNSPMGTSPRK